jgi:hypothetical protein
MPIMNGSVEDEENFFLASTEYTTQTPYSVAQYNAAIAAYPNTTNSYTALGSRMAPSGPGIHKCRPAMNGVPRPSL